MPSIAQSLKQTITEGVNARTRRFGFFPGLLPTQAVMESIHSGQQELMLPQGVLVRFDTAELKESNFRIHDEDWKGTHMVEHSAQWFITNVKRTYERLGFVELDPLTPMEDDEAERYFDTVHPSLLNRECPQGLKLCSTCRIKSLQEVSFDDAVAEELRMRLLQSYVAVNDYYRGRWVEILKDYRRGLVTMSDGEKHVRLNLHELDPETLAADASRAYGEQGAAATQAGMERIAESIKGAIQPQSNGDLTAILAQIAATQAQQGQILAQLTSNQNSSISASVTEKIDKRTKEYRDAHRSESEAGDADIS